MNRRLAVIQDASAQPSRHFQTRAPVAVEPVAEENLQAHPGSLRPARQFRKQII
jgi:hypothetical protein